MEVYDVVAMEAARFRTGEWDCVNIINKWVSDRDVKSLSSSRGMSIVDSQSSIVHSQITRSR